jgi:predicted metal-dependent hydrolase
MWNMDHLAKILAFVKDINFAIRIESAAEKKGLKALFIENAEQITISHWLQDGDKSTNPWNIHGGILFDKITTLRPALLIFDLGNDQIPWQHWITLLSSDPSTRRIPIICYGPHVEVSKLKAAKTAGAELVVSRSRFVNTLPDLLEKHAKVKTTAQLHKMCQKPLSNLAVQGLEEFNRGEYFEAHESLEIAWLGDDSPGRDVYRAILQIAVAYYQVTRGNYKGSIKMFLRLRQWLDPLPGVCRGINILQLRSEVCEVQQALLELGPERVSEFDLNLLRPIEYKGLN